jgi:hypothetical protein
MAELTDEQLEAQFHEAAEKIKVWQPKTQPSDDEKLVSGKGLLVFSYDPLKPRRVTHL